MAGTREIRRRIRSIQSTKKITRAMQMISAAKMRKAQQAAFASRNYADLAWNIVTNLSDKVDPKYHSLLQVNPAAQKKTGIILISSNRGMIGGFNNSLVSEVSKFISENDEETDIAADFIAVGRKGRDAMARRGEVIMAEFTKVDRAVRLEEILPIARLLVDEYLKGTYNKIVLAYTHFYSTVTQKPRIKLILPLRQKEKTSLINGKGRENSESSRYEYLFEPSPDRVLDYLIPRIIESQIYQAILESDASEHSARMLMMKNATDAASDLISDLTLAYNQIRQANITRELSEITAGRIALE